MISVVIPTRNSAASLEACLRSVLAQDRECEIIIADSSSTDGTREIAEKHGVNVLEINARPPAARNLGFSKAKGNIFLSLDSDMILESGALGQIENGMAGNGALILPEKGHGRGFLSECKALEKRIYLSSSAEAARAFTREAFEAVGGYSERLHFGEDWDLHGRIAGKFPVGRTSAGVLHDTSGLSLGSLLAKSYRYGKSLPEYLESGGTGRFLGTRKNFICGCLSMIPAKPAPAIGLLALKGMEYAAGTAGFVAGKIRPG